MSEQSGEQQFDLSKYQIASEIQKKTVTIEETGDSFEVSIKQMSWAKRNQLANRCIVWKSDGSSNFNGDLYIKECLKEMIVEAPWGKTTESFLITIDERLGAALESLVPQAFAGDSQTNPDTIKKE